MKKWQIIKYITITILVAFIIYIIFDAVKCMQMNYPHPTLGTDAHNWFDQFRVDLIFILITCGIPLIIDIILLVKSTKKLSSK